LDTVNKDLQKLKNLCDFPNVLKQDLNDYKHTNESKMAQSFSEAPKLFSKTIVLYE
jgi:predicted DNA binding CopG/RHH family protein